MHIIIQYKTIYYKILSKQTFYIVRSFEILHGYQHANRF